MSLPNSGTVQNPEQFAQIIRMLRNGGYILYVRHGEASIGVDYPNLHLQNCVTQRNLSETGRRQAVYYGQLLRQLQIPIMYPILASPFCRTRETAIFAFGREVVQTDPFWLEINKLSGSVSAVERQRIMNTFHSILEVSPIQGSNKVIIAHSFPRGVGLGEIPNMGTVIVRPRGQGNSYEIVAKLTLDALRNFAGQMIATNSSSNG
jgi:hypothetical protein